VHVLLPPSETKNPGGRGRPIRHRTPDHPLADGRAAALDALANLVAGDPESAAQALLLPAGVAPAALAADARVRDAPTTTALRRYAGTVYLGLAYDTMTPAQQRVAARSTLVFSGLFGVVRGNEAVPDYRVPAKAVLPGIGVAATYWRARLAPLLRDSLRRGLIVDLRSGDYAAMWRPDPVTRERVVAVRVLSPVPRGGHGVVSFVSKLAKGRLAAQLVRSCAEGAEPHTAGDVAAAWLACGGSGSATTSAGLDLYTG
jgi:cytoplasmic iron level regulating protein YaaA (DUF328/UPF0246 family)